MTTRHPNTNVITKITVSESMKGTLDVRSFK